MRHKYQILLQNNERHVREGSQRLSRNRELLLQQEAECDRLMQALEVQRQLASAAQPDGGVLSKQQLYAWLRRDAADRRRTHALRVDMQRQETVVNDCKEKVASQREKCIDLERRRERYQNLLKKESKRLSLIQMNTEEEEIEERLAWKK